MNEPAASNSSEGDAGRPCDWRDAAQEYLLGSMEAVRASAFEAHLEGGCALCRSEFDLVSETLARIDLLVAREELDRDPGLAPSPGLREKLLERVATEPKVEIDRVWRNWTSIPGRAAGAGLMTVAGSEGEWESIGIQGIEVRRLSADSVRRTATMLVRMSAGTRYPRHRHAAREECFVLSGDLHHRELVLHAGDFQVAEPGSEHEVQWTEQGCLLYISSSQDDELIA